MSAQHDRRATLGANDGRPRSQGWRQRAEALRGPLAPDASWTLSASEIGAYTFCFVPMSTSPSRALLEALWNGAPLSCIQVVSALRRRFGRVPSPWFRLRESDQIRRAARRVSFSTYATCGGATGLGRDGRRRARRPPDEITLAQWSAQEGSRTRSGGRRPERRLRLESGAQTDDRPPRRAPPTEPNSRPLPAVSASGGRAPRPAARRTRRPA
jgi:hypothetical protein